MGKLCCLLIKKNWWYFCWRLQSSTNQLYLQKFILSPHPTFQPIFWWIMLKSDCWFSFLRSFHHWECHPLSLPFCKSDHPPYLEFNTVTHNWCWLKDKSQIHVPLKVALNLERSLIPRPPSFLGRQITSHFTEGIFLWSWFPPHIKFLWRDNNLSTILWGILKKDNR